MEKHTMLALCTSHVSQDTADLLDRIAVGVETITGLIVYDKSEFGWFLPITDDTLHELENNECPTDIFECLAFAAKQDCDWVMFDRDVEPVDELKTYEWDMPEEKIDDTGVWIKTDDLQICKKIKQGVYLLAEFTQADTDIFCFSHDKVILDNYRDSDGEWDTDAIGLIKSYYPSLEEMRESVRDKNEEDQIVAEIIFESTSQLDTDTDPMSEDDAAKYLDDIISGAITLEF